VTKSGWRILMAILVPFTLFGVIYTYYGMYKILTSRCSYCGSKELGGKFRKAVIFGFTPWRKPKLVCLDCQKKKKKT